MDLARKNVVEDWIQNYPGIVANGHVPDSTDNLISKYFDAIVALAEQTHPEEYSKGGTESFLKTTGFRFVASELQTLKDSYFSKIEYFTAFPYWWGDFLNRCLKSINPHLFRTFMSRMDILFARAILLKQLDLKDVYCIQDGIPILLLEQECTNWAYELLKIDPVLEQDQKNPLIPFFRFHPEKFVPSTLAMVKLRREMSKMPNSRAKTPNLEWFKPIMALPALFTYSKPCAQNFDKRILLLRVRDLLIKDPWAIDMKQAILNLGLYLTWSPRIHEFASLDDQQKILSMYLSSILDPGSAFFGLPIELFRKILEENFFLGKKHKQCDECVQNRGNEFHGLVGSKYLLSCCLYECRCFNNYIYEKNELCMGKNPMRELWGMGVGMWKDVDDEYHDTSKYRELI